MWMEEYPLNSIQCQSSSDDDDERWEIRLYRHRPSGLVWSGAVQARIKWVRLVHVIRWWWCSCWLGKSIATGAWLEGWLARWIDLYVLVQFNRIHFGVTKSDEQKINLLKCVSEFNTQRLLRCTCTDWYLSGRKTFQHFVCFSVRVRGSKEICHR